MQGYRVFHIHATHYCLSELIRELGKVITKRIYIALINYICNSQQVIKTFSIREGCWYIGIKGDGGIKSKGTKHLTEKDDVHVLAACCHIELCAGHTSLQIHDPFMERAKALLK